MPDFKIAIIGAGPAGCMLARLLHLENIDTTVFESEDSPNYRAQGGSLDLHTSTGLAAMKAAGLWDAFLKYARYDSQYMAIVDKDLKYFMRRNVTSKTTKIEERPEIDRSRLRQILTESLPESMIKWGHRLKRIEDDNTLVFEHTTVSGFDLIVGADGAWSKVRPLLAPGSKPVYAGVSIHELAIPEAQHTAPEVYKLVGRGTVFACSDGKRLAMQQMGDGSINVYAGSVRDDPDCFAPEKCGYDAHNLEETRKALLEEYHDWSPKLKEALVKTSGKCIPRSFFVLPVGFKWTHHPGATLIGDAAHLMTPYAGEGVNVALEDSMKLAAAIIEAAKEGGSKELLDKKVEIFEKEMFPRAEKVQRLSDDLLHLWMYTPGTPGSVLAKAMVKHVNFRTPWVIHPIASIFVHAYFFMRRMPQPPAEVDEAR